MRVGLEFAFKDEMWLGGVYGIANLLRALALAPDCDLEPVLVAPKAAPAKLFEGLPNVEILRTDLVDTDHYLHLVRRVLRRAFGRDVLMEYWLKSKRIEVFSHCESLGRNSRFPTIGHIADFNYKYFPELYSDADRKKKEEGYARVFDEYDLMIVWSRVVMADYAKFFPNARAKCACVHPAPSTPPGVSPPDLRTLLDRYKIPESFFYVPNQFWVHKNHQAIVDALALLKARNKLVHVVSTGAKLDSRQPEYFDALMRKVVEKGVADRFHVLGVVPFADTIALMRESMAVLQSSLFEGWGLTVTEAKMMGKLLILSDLPVFREQAPAHAIYFDPKSASELAEAMMRVADAFSPEEELQRQAAAAPVRAAALAAYARGYEKIVREAAKLAGVAPNSAQMHSPSEAADQSRLPDHAARHGEANLEKPFSPVKNTTSGMNAGRNT